MRIAIITDIHGNLTALEAALSAISEDAPDQIICLGDVVVNGPQPQAALARIRDLGCPVVLGNTDEWVLHPKPFTIRNEDDQILYDIEQWGAEQIGSADRAFIRTFQPTVTVDLGDNLSLLCFHGSPRNNNDTIIATTPVDEVGAKLDGQRATVMAGGHTHMPFLRRFEDAMILNPGCVGLPYYVKNGKAYNPAWAEYAMVSVDNGRLDVAFRRVPYTLATLQKAVRQSRMPHQDRFLAGWIAA